MRASWLHSLRQPLALWLIAAVVHGFYALEPPGSDQGLFMAEADLLLRGSTLYNDVWEHKPPGSMALYAVAMQLFGHDYGSIKLLSWLVAAITSSMLYLLGLRAGLSRAAAMFGATVYLVFGAGPAFGGFWALAQAETFLDPLLCVAMLFLLPRVAFEPTATQSPRALSVLRCFCAGVAIGTGIATIKYSAFPWLALAILCRSAPHRVRHAGPLAFAAGCSVPALMLCSYFAATGRARAWFDATLVFNLQHRSIGAVAFWDDPFGKIFPSVLVLLVLYVFALIALATWIKSQSRAAASGWLKLSALLWLLALMQVLVQRKFWGYHYHVLLVPLAALVAIGFQQSVSLLSRRLDERRAVLICIAAAVVLSFGYVRRCVRYAEQHSLIGAITGGVPREQFELSYSWGKHVYDYATDRLVSAQVKRTTRDTDHILVWTFEPLIYFLAERKPATRFLFDYPLTQPGSTLRERYVALLMQDLEARPPALILTRSNDRNSIEAEDSASQLASIPALASYLAAHYAPAWAVDDFVCLARKPE